MLLSEEDESLLIILSAFLSWIYSIANKYQISKYYLDL